MNQLLEDYFKRDLDDQEEERLGQWLASHPEGTQSLIDRMEQHYLSLGVTSPEPEWSEQPLPGFFPKPKKGLIWFLILILFAGALVLAAYGLQRWLVQTPLSLSALSPASEALPETEVPTPPAAQSMVKKSPSHSRGKTYEELSVVVDNPQPGLVVVNVLDSQNRNIRVLYGGILPAGRKTFIWDGKKADGSLSPAGTYLLEVKSGASVMRREVQLH